jgi:hypothetical protein
LRDGLPALADDGLDDADGGFHVELALSALSGPFSVTTEDRSDARRTFRSRQLIDLEHRIDALPVPVVFQVGGMQALFTMPVRRAARVVRLRAQ